MPAAATIGLYETAPRGGSCALRWRVWEESKAGVSTILACSSTEHSGGMDLESAIRAEEIIAENLQHSLQWRRYWANNIF